MFFFVKISGSFSPHFQVAPLHPTAGSYHDGFAAHFYSMHGNRPCCDTDVGGPHGSLFPVLGKIKDHRAAVQPGCTQKSAEAPELGGEGGGMEP